MLSIYPAITITEIGEACKILQRAYTTSVEVTDWIQAEKTAEGFFIRQKRTLLRALHVPKIEGEEDDERDSDEIEQEDEELLQRNPPEPLQDIFIDYSIVLSPTYQVPVLWFSSKSIPMTSTHALDRVYEEIVSPVSRTGLRQIGVLGGISLAEHPINGLPAFFIHPCRTQEALEVVQPDKDISPIEYMMLWFGIIGTPVGLSLPLEIAKSISTPGGKSCDRAEQLAIGNGHNM